jgi:hypothetical protein
MSSGNGNGNGNIRRHHAKAQHREPIPQFFATHTQIEGREFTDVDGTVYEVIWPIGNLPLRAILESQDSASE